jgi:hypothetical protein
LRIFFDLAVAINNNLYPFIPSGVPPTLGGYVGEVAGKIIIHFPLQGLK